MTPRMRECLDAIKRLTVDGVPPTYDALRLELGLANRGRVHKLLVDLKARGLVAWEPCKKHSLRVLGEVDHPDHPARPGEDQQRFARIVDKVAPFVGRSTADRIVREAWTG